MGAALKAVLIVLFSLLTAQIAEARQVYGATIPDPSDPVAGQAGRFILRRPFDRVLKDLRRTYGRSRGVVIREMATPPRVKYYWIENTREGRSWDGINLYEDPRTRTVYVTVLRAKK